MVDIIWTIWYGKKSIFKYSYGPYQMGLYHMDHMIWELVLPYNTVFLLCSFHTNSIVLLITNIIIPKSVLNIHWDTIFISLVPVIWFSLCPMCIAENKGFKTRNKIQHPVFSGKFFLRECIIVRPFEWIDIPVLISFCSDPYSRILTPFVPCHVLNVRVQPEKLLKS